MREQFIANSQAQISKCINLSVAIGFSFCFGTSSEISHVADIINMRAYTLDFLLDIDRFKIK